MYPTSAATRVAPHHILVFQSLLIKPGNQGCGFKIGVCLDQDCIEHCYKKALYRNNFDFLLRFHLRKKSIVTMLIF